MQLGQLGDYFGKNCHILVLKLCRLDEWVTDTGSEFQILGLGRDMQITWDWLDTKAFDYYWQLLCHSSEFGHLF